MKDLKTVLKASKILEEDGIDGIQTAIKLVGYEIALPMFISSQRIMHNKNLQYPGNPDFENEIISFLKKNNLLLNENFKNENMKAINSLEAFKDLSPVQLQSLEENEVVEMIKRLNTIERYWYQETVSMQNPVPNMSPDQSTSFSNVTSDVFKEGKIFEPFIDFLFNAVKFFPNLVMYVHQDRFGFNPIFCLTFSSEYSNELHLIKFQKKHLSKDHFVELINILYSKENINKHEKFGLKEIREIEYYEY